MDSATVNAFMNAGLSFIPCSLDKRPLVNWEDYQYKRPEPDEISEMPFRDAPCIAIIAGGVSGNVICIDFDIKNDPHRKIWDEFCEKIKEEGLSEVIKKTTIQRTASGGYHVVYKTTSVGRNEKLAMPAGGKKPIIETRANGGYFLVHPSENYTLIHGDFTKLATLSEEHHSKIISVCQQLSRRKKATVRQITPATQQKGGKSQKTVENIVKQIEKAELDITASYEDWVKIGHALAHEFGDDGREFFHRVSSFHADYDEYECNKKYDNLLQQRGGRRHATILSFYAIAKEYGVDIRDPYEGNKYEKFIQKQTIHYNEIRQAMENKDKVPWTDFDLNELAVALEKNCGYLGDNRIKRYLVNRNNLICYHPIRDYFDELEFRDYPGEPIDEFLAQFDLYNPAWLPLMKKWLLGVVGSAYGHPYEHMLVLISEQGIGKTLFFENLLPEKLRQYHTRNSLKEGKDSDKLLTEKLIVNDDEYGRQTMKDSRHLKALLSARTFSMRLPYGKTIQDFKRLAVLCGCSNDLDVLNDNTGNRRLFPVHVRDRDYDINDRIDRDDLWAALVQMWLAGEHPYALSVPTIEEQRFIREQSEGYQTVNIERETIAKLFRASYTDDDGVYHQGEFMTATDVCKVLADHLGSGVKIFPKKVGQELVRMGFERIQKRHNGIPRYGYHLVVVDPDSGNPKEDLPF